METGNNRKFTIWHNRSFVLLFSSYTISAFGRYFDMLAVMLMISYVWQADPWMISIIPVVYALPHAVFSQFVGVYIDRGKKVRIILFADFLAMLFTIILIFAGNPWWMLTIIFFRSCLSVVHFPAQQALVKQIVHRELIIKAVTLSGTVNQLSKIIGPFLGASIAAAFSPRMSFAVYAISLLISVCVLFFVRHVDREESEKTDEFEGTDDSFWKSWRSAWGVMFRSRILFASFSFSMIAFFAIQLVDAQFAVLTRELFPDNPSVFGWLVSGVGLGAVLILLFLNRMNKINRYGLFLGSAVFLIGTGIFILGLLQTGNTVWLLIAASLVIGFGTGLFSAVFSYILQVESPDGKVGQMSGMYNSLTGIMLIIAPLLGGLLVQLFGVFTIFQVIGMVTFLTGLLGLSLQRMWWGSGEKKEKQIEKLDKGERGLGHY